MTDRLFAKIQRPLTGRAPWTLLVVAVLVSSLLMRWPQMLVAVVLENAGMIVLAHAVTTGVPDEGGRAAGLLSLATHINPGSATRQENLGIARYLAGDVNGGAQHLRTAWTAGSRDRRTADWLARVCDAAGDASCVVEALESPSLRQILAERPAYQEMFIINALQLGQARADGSDVAGAKAAYEAVLQIDQTNVAAASGLKLLGFDSAEAEQAASLPWVASNPGSPRLREVESIGLFAGIQAGWWTPDEELRVLRLLVWQGRPTVARSAAAHLLGGRVEAASVHNLLGELGLRSNDFAGAEDGFRASLSHSPGNTVALWGLAQASQIRSVGGEPARAVASFNDDVQVRPDDPAGPVAPDRLAKDAAPNRGESQSLAQGLDVEAAVASLLSISRTQVTVGLELVRNGDFEETNGDKVGDWQESRRVGGEHYWPGSFAIGIDRLMRFSGQVSARMDGLSLIQAKGKAMPREGFRSSPVHLSPATCYALTFAYRTVGLRDGQFELWGAETSGTGSAIFVRHLGLPATDSTWRLFVGVDCTPPGSAGQSNLELTINRPGSAWVDAVSLRPLNISSEGLAISWPRYQLR